MKLLLAAVVAIAVAAAVSSAAQPVELFEPESEVLGLAVSGSRLFVAYANGTLAAYELPLLKAVSVSVYTFKAKLVGMGTLSNGLLILAFDNGTILAVDPVSGRAAWSASVGGGRLERAVVGGRWVVAVTRYLYSTGKDSFELNRVVVYDAYLGAATFVIDRSSDVRLVYAFDVKVSGNLLLLVGIDTTCEICRLTDTYVAVYNLTSYERLFAERIGECKADISGSVLVAARTEDGAGFLYDAATGRLWRFNLNAKVIAAKAWKGEGYLLAQKPSGGVALYRVRADTTSSIGEYPEGFSLALLNGTPVVVGTSAIYVDKLQLSLPREVPWRPSAVLEYGRGILVLYGKWALMHARLAADAPGTAFLFVRTEPGAMVEVPRLGVAARANGSGVAVLRLPPGSYEVRASKEGFPPSSSNITLAAGEEKVLELRLAKPALREPAANITLIARCSSVLDNNVTVEVIADNGGVAASYPLSNVTLSVPAPGNYTLRAQSGGSLWVKRLALQPGAQEVVEIDCASRPPRANVSTRPAVASSRELIAMVAPLVQINATRSRLRISGLPPVRDIDGRVVELDRGVRLLVFFYTKCLGCERLVPKLKDLRLEVVMISPSSFDDEASLRSYRERVNASGWYWVLDEDSRLSRLFNVSVFPTLVVVDEGEVLFVGLGAAGETQQLAEAAIALLRAAADWAADPAVAAVVAGILLLLVSTRPATGSNRLGKP